MDNYMGVDPGKVWGLSIIGDGKLLKHEYIDNSNFKDIMIRVYLFYARICIELEYHNPKMVVIEEPPFVRNIKGYGQLKQYEAAAWLACENFRTPYVSEQNKILKKWFTGNGSAKKVDIMEAALDRYNLRRPIFDKKEALLWENAYDAVQCAAYAEWLSEEQGVK